jgi:hypothetical protein
LSVKEWNGEAFEIDMDVFRKTRLDYDLISDAQMMVLGVSHDHGKPWIDLDTVEPIREGDIVIGRTGRYHGPFDWGELATWQDRCVFVGSEDEHGDFEAATGLRIRRVRTASWKVLAGVIRGGKLFVGNQSFSYSLAEAMKVQRVLETCVFCPNCDPRGPDGHVRLTQGVIRRYVEGEGRAEGTGMSRNPMMRQPFRSIKLQKGGNPNMSLVIPAVGRDEDVAALEDETRRMGCPVVVVKDGSSFETMANIGVSRVPGGILCVADPRERVRFADAEAVAQQLMDSNAGMAGACMSMRMRPHVSGPCLAVSRKAYEQMGLFNPVMRPGALNMLELNLRYAKGRVGCKSASMTKWMGWAERDDPENDGPNVNYIERVYGVRL